MKRGAMDPEGSNALDRNRDKLEDILNPEDIIGKLISLDVIDGRDEEEILKETTKLRRVVTFIRIIKQRGNEAYPMLLEALRCKKYDDLVESLEETRLNSEKKSQEFVDQTQEATPINTETDLLGLSEDLIDFRDITTSTDNNVTQVKQIVGDAYQTESDPILGDVINAQDVRRSNDDSVTDVKQINDAVPSLHDKKTQKQNYLLRYQRQNSSTLIKEFETGTKTAASCLKEFCEKLKLKISYKETTAVNSKFGGQWTVDDICYPHGEGKSKQDAKNDAAKKALQMIFRTEEEDVNVSGDNSGNSPNTINRNLNTECDEKYLTNQKKFTEMFSKNDQDVKPEESVITHTEGEKITDRLNITGDESITIPKKVDDQNSDNLSLLSETDNTKVTVDATAEHPKENKAPIVGNINDDGITPNKEKDESMPFSKDYPASIGAARRLRCRMIPPNLIKDFQKETKHPMMCMKEYCELFGFEMSFQETTLSGSRFGCVCICDGKSYQQGEGATKKEAKKEAAKNAFTELLELEQEGFFLPAALRWHARDHMVQTPKVVPQVLLSDFLSRAKNPVSCVKEYCDIKKQSFQINEAASIGNFGFSFVCTVAGFSYRQALGKTKQEAENNAAEIALKGIFKMEGIPESLISDFLSGAKNPVSSLKEYCEIKKIPFQIDSIESDVPQTFRFKCTCDRIPYPEGHGESKKEAKNNAAKIAFKDILGIE